MRLFDRTITFIKSDKAANRRKLMVGAAALASTIALFLVLAGANAAPRAFPLNAVFTVREGSSIATIADELRDRGIIRSAALFKKLVIILGRERYIVAGDYYFPDAQTLYGVVKRVTAGEYGLVPIKMTIPEGTNVYEIADMFAGKFSRFDRERFIELARDKEGYLFPDTYFFMPNVEADDVVILLSDNFDAKAMEISEAAAKAGRTIHEAVTMASILEEEAATMEDRKIVSGILWERIRIGMPLQVDVTFVYVNGKKNSFDLTKSDLKSDSPYNTYANKGLPPGPISNPGLDAIKAALEPTKTKYLYYLSDNSYNMYYAEDFEGHKRNRELYLGR